MQYIPRFTLLNDEDCTMSHFLEKIRFSTLICILLFSFSVNSAEKNILLKPFTLAKIYKNNSVTQIAKKVRKQLTASGFKVVGVYEPYQTTKIFIVSNPLLLKTASKSQFGGFGAGIRVSITQVKKKCKSLIIIRLIWALHTK